MCMVWYRPPVQRMSTVDAAMYWSSATQHSDIFTILCFDAPDLCFDAPDASVFMDAVLSELRERARRIDDLCLRVLNVPGDLDWPHWVRSDIGPDAFAVHSKTPNAPGFGGIAVLDEIQYCPGLFSHLQVRVEAARRMGQ